jgi:hypothetical protein
VDVYDVPGGAGSAAGMEEGVGAADEKIAEEFKREFMDAIMRRRQRKRPATNAPGPKPKPKTQDEILRGPKLGGSRNTRAAMRDILLKEQEQRKKRR